MANPTGSTYLQANNTYSWVDGDIYEIPQTDQVEGAATGASFSGLGVENQPHQVILNKVQLTHVNQLADEVNIAALLTFKSLFTSTIGISGFVRLGVQDSNLGQIDIIVQWGTLSTIGWNSTIAGTSTPMALNFPIAFPNAIYVLHPWVQSNQALGLGSEGLHLFAYPATPLQKQGNKIILSASQVGSFQWAQTPTDGKGVTGVGWIAMGY
jgi:hypothetical protein